MANEILCLFKSSRRTEYTQENLRILSGAVGDEVEVSYKERGLSDAVRERLPEAGDPVLAVLADPPYSKSHVIRRAELVESSYDGDTLRLRLRLGARVAADQNRWKPLTESGPNPKDRQFAVYIDVPDGILEEATEPRRELKTWKKQVDAVSHADGYGRVAFLRVIRVSEVGGTEVEPPYHLVSGRTYQVDILAHNPHLEPETLEALRLVAFADASIVDIAMESQPIPADGVIELMLAPQEEGKAALEFSVSRGAEFWFALEFDWQTTAPEPGAEPAVSDIEPVTEQPGVVEPVSVTPATPTAVVSDDVSRHLLRGYMLLRSHHEVPPAIRARLLDELLEAAPGNQRLLEQRGIVLHEQRHWAEAVDVLDGLAPGGLSPEGRIRLVASWFMQGLLPEPIERIKIADLSRDEWFEDLQAASKRLSTEEQVAVARLLAGSVLAEDRASRWISPLALDDELPRRDRLDLLEIWQYADPAAAAAGVEELATEGRIELAEPDMAKIALDLGIEARRPRLGRRAAWALLAHYANLGDVPELEGLLDTVMTQFARDDRREVGREVVMTIADIADDDDDIDRALEAAAELIEDERQRGDLDAAARLATFARANEHRASKPVRHRLRDVLVRLEDALENSKAIQLYNRAREQELNLDLKNLIGGKRVLVLGANKQPWWDEVRQEFGFDVNSDWLSTEREKAQPAKDIIKKLDNYDLLIVQIGRIGHKTSEPVMKAAKDRGLRTITVPRPTRQAFTMVLRAELVDKPGPLDGLDLGSLAD